MCDLSLLLLWLAVATGGREPIPQFGAGFFTHCSDATVSCIATPHPVSLPGPLHGLGLLTAQQTLDSHIFYIESHCSHGPEQMSLPLLLPTRMSPANPESTTPWKGCQN